MSSNINPEMRGTIDIKPFKMWCQKVLPQVYDDSLSYYEVLGKLVVYLNEVIENVETDGENVLTLHQAFLDLQTYVNEFFDDIGQLPDYVEQARQYAVDSQDSATRSAQYASNSAASASNSADAALNAVQSANAASQSKDSAANSAQNAANYMQNALNSAHDSEAWAVGTIGGVPVPPTNIRHENNSKWWASKSKEWYEYARDLIASLPENVDEILEMYQSLAPLRDSEELSGSIVNFESDFKGVPLKKIVAEIQPVQSGSGVPSPTNVRAISGWTGAEVTRTGKNLFGGITMGQTIVDAVNDHSNTYLGSDEVGDYVTFAAGFEMDNKTIFSNFKPNTQYTIILKFKKENINSINLNISIEYTDGTANTLYADTPAELQTKAFVTQEGKSLLRLRTTFGGSRTFLYYNESGIFEGVLTKDQFVPYNGNQISVTFPSEAGTVYGGKLTLNPDGTGEMLVDKKIRTYNGSESWADYAEYEGFYHAEDSDVAISTRADGYCNLLRVSKSSNAGQKNACWIGINSRNIFALGVYETMGNTVNGFKAYLEEHNMQLTLPLANPITYTLTAEQVSGIMSTLKGINNVWANTGNVTITVGGYVETITENLSTKIPLNILTANIEKTYNASKNYAVNDFLVINNTLYKVTATIAQDGTIIPSTNVVSTTIMDEITALLNA